MGRKLKSHNSMVLKNDQTCMVLHISRAKVVSQTMFPPNTNKLDFYLIKALRCFVDVVIPEVEPRDLDEVVDVVKGGLLTLVDAVVNLADQGLSCFEDLLRFFFQKLLMDDEKP